VRIESGPVFELLATVAAFLHKEQHAYYDLGGSWFDRIASKAPDSARRLRTFAGGSAMIWDHLFGLAVDAGPDRGTQSFADHVARMDAELLRLELLGRNDRPVQRAVGIERIERAAAGDATAQRDFLRLAWPEESAWQTGARQLLKQPAAVTQQALASLLRQLQADLSPFIDPALPALEADAAERRDAAASLDPLALIQSAIDTPYTPTGDVQGVVLIPSFVVRPFVFYIEHGDRMLFVYPVPERLTASMGAAAPDRLVRLASALGDRGRLRILAALRERNMSLKELGETLNLPRSTLRHHVGILRGAGLLRPMQSGTGFSSYQLREEAATDLSELVQKFLRPGTEPAPQPAPAVRGKRTKR
jgi:DNA-binding transcriptional ArsR family regulator